MNPLLQLPSHSPQRKTSAPSSVRRVSVRTSCRRPEACHNTATIFLPQRIEACPELRRIERARVSKPLRRGGGDFAARRPKPPNLRESQVSMTGDWVGVVGVVLQSSLKSLSLSVSPPPSGVQPSSSSVVDFPPSLAGHSVHRMGELEGPDRGSEDGWVLGFGRGEGV